MSKVIIVTGASRGIGHAIAQCLLASSHRVVLTARSEGPLAETKAAHPGQVEYVAGDITDTEVTKHTQKLPISFEIYRLKVSIFSEANRCTDSQEGRCRRRRHLWPARRRGSQPRRPDAHHPPGEYEHRGLEEALRHQRLQCTRTGKIFPPTPA